MNRRIAAFAIATVAVLGLAGCAGSTSEDNADEPTDSSNTSTEDTTKDSDQSVKEACGIVLPKLTEANSAASSIDPTGGTDPQATVDQFNEVVAAFGEAADSVSNTEVKEATTTLYENFQGLSEVLSKVLVEQDMTAAEGMSKLTTEITEASSTLQKLCS